MSQTFEQNKINEENKINADKINCCICYNNREEGSNEEGSNEEGSKGELIECCPNKHILCIECFHKSYERKCECPLCRELMFKPEIMTRVELIAYFGAKLVLKLKREREEEERRLLQEREEKDKILLDYLIMKYF
jgi:hypothetical protein